MILRGLGKREHRDTVGPSVRGGPCLVLPRVRVQHSTAPHNVRDHVKIPAEVCIAEVREDRTVAVDFLDEAGEPFLGDPNEETLAQILISLRVVQGEVDLRVLADRVAEIPHAEVKMMGQHLSVLLPPESSPSRRPLRILRALNVLKSIKREKGGMRERLSAIRTRYREYPDMISSICNDDARISNAERSCHLTTSFEERFIKNKHTGYRCSIVQQSIVPLSFSRN